MRQRGNNYLDHNKRRAPHVLKFDCELVLDGRKLVRIRVHAISPGPLKTRAASGIPEFDQLLEKAQEKAPARSLVSIDDVGIAVAFLATDAAKLITGETLYIDGGYHIMD